MHTKIFSSTTNAWRIWTAIMYGLKKIAAYMAVLVIALSVGNIVYAQSKNLKDGVYFRHNTIDNCEKRNAWVDVWLKKNPEDLPADLSELLHFTEDIRRRILGHLAPKTQACIWKEYLDIVLNLETDKCRQEAIIELEALIAPELYDPGNPLEKEAEQRVLDWDDRVVKDGVFSRDQLVWFYNAIHSYSVLPQAVPYVVVPDRATETVQVAHLIPRCNCLGPLWDCPSMFELCWPLTCDPLFEGCGPLGILPCVGTCGSRLRSTNITNFGYTVHIELRDMPLTLSFYQSGIVDLARNWEYRRLKQSIFGLNLDSELIRYGEKLWVKGDLPFMDYGFWSPQYPDMAQPSINDLVGISSVPGIVNGVNTSRYILSGEKLVELVGNNFAIPDRLNFPNANLWISDTYGVPVKITMEVASPTGEQGSLYFELNVTLLNSPNIPKTLPSHVLSKLNPNLDSLTDDEPDVIDWLHYFALGLIEALSGGFEPEAVYHAAEMAEENLPNVEAVIENVEEYQEVYSEDEVEVRRAFRDIPEDKRHDGGFLYKWFWSWIESL
jgi:hypothetical protein